jgi:hypothetical protein
MVYSFDVPSKGIAIKMVLSLFDFSSNVRCVDWQFNQREGSNGKWQYSTQSGPIFNSLFRIRARLAGHHGSRHRFPGWSLHGWDDGAITLAYSRTFAETGRIALTAASEQVEGFSSISWFLINAVIGLVHPGFTQAVLASQIAAGFFLGVAAFFIWLIAQDFRFSTYTTLAILLVFSLFGPSFSEVANGMEMTLLTASGLALIYTLYVRESRVLLMVAIVVFLTTRFEAMFYYAFMLMPLLIRKRFQAFVLLASFGLAVVGESTRNRGRLIARVSAGG